MNLSESFKKRLKELSGIKNVMNEIILFPDDVLFPATFTILTQQAADKAKAKNIVPSYKHNGYHFTVKNREELNQLMDLYKEGNKYNNEDIIGTDVNDIKFGQL